MEIQNEQFRNCTVSFRTTSQHKLQISRLAEASKLSASEYLLHLVTRFGQPIDQFTGEPREVKNLKESIKTLERDKRQLEVKLENADIRVSIEQEVAVKQAERCAKAEAEALRLRKELSKIQKLLVEQMKATESTPPDEGNAAKCSVVVDADNDVPIGLSDALLLLLSVITIGRLNSFRN